ncbi:hypothetical protein D9619_009189 [Psilocybe cf. subviscida]|uniref:Uncharacterized protein n=1 Tax=Psilocybe cf. subviscida TaxID=2480587 RepID=A0A8H5BUV0_9AGAR|nr:hypothetical protein D9619_009189 [Psilocybe cf. subviscida]
MIIDEKFIMLPNTPYLSGPSSSVRSSPYASSVALPNLRRRKGLTFTSLPAHILLQIIHDTFPHNQPQVPTYSPTHLVTPYRYTPYNQQAVFINHEDYETLAERQRKTLYWLSTSLRLVSRQLYTACMHVLRSTYFQTYAGLVRPGYSTDPFPMGVPTAPVPVRTSPVSSSTAGLSSSAQRLPAPEDAPPPAYRAPSPSPSSRSAGSSKTRASASSAASPETESPLVTPQRETHVLDRFILLKLRSDIFADESSLHMDCDDGFKDIFDVAQPRARLEDLVRMYGAQDGVVYVPGWSNAAAAGAAVSRLHRIDSPSSSVGSLPLPRNEVVISVPASPSLSSPSPTAAGKRRMKLFSFGRKTTIPTSPVSPPHSPALTSAIAAPRASTSSSVSEPRPVRVTPVAFPLLSISFAPRKVGLLLKRSRTIVEVPRTPGRKESLESLAQALVRELRLVLEEGGYPIV